MTIRHIHIFLAVCACGSSATKAAQPLHLTQPAVSAAIRELETHYGVPLFDRVGRRLVLTQQGRRFQTYGQRIAGLFQDLDRELRHWDQVGKLTMGASLTIGSRFLPQALRAFAAQRPEVEVQVTVAPSKALEEALLDHRLDLALMEGLPHAPALQWEAYQEDHLAVLAAPHGPVPPGTALTPDAFVRQPLLLREKGSGTREEFDRVMEAAGLTPRPRWESVSNTALLQAAAAGLGLAVLSRQVAAEAIAQGKVGEVAVEGLVFRRQFRVVWHREKVLSPLARDLLQVVLDQAAPGQGRP